LNNAELVRSHHSHGRLFFVRGFTAIRTIKIALAALFCLSIYGNTALSNADLERQPNTLLVISGNLDSESVDNKIAFDMNSLLDLPATEVTTNNRWLPGPVKFTGIRISDLLNSVGAQSNEIEARAANEYKFRLTNIDFDKYPIIVAYMKDGKPMSVRELGPLWIIFPFDDFPELLNDRNEAASVWQLTDIEIL
jgi:hypothetical protein